MKTTALFPGSFDPFTLGHKAVVDSGLTMFDRIVVGIGVNCDKKGFLVPEKRKRLIEKVYEGDPRIEVAIYNGLTGDFCRSRNIKHILRGLRTAADFDYEHSIEMANSEFFPEITTLAVFTPARLAYVSSSLVREITAVGADPTKLIPSGINIKDYL